MPRCTCPSLSRATRGEVTSPKPTVICFVVRPQGIFFGVLHPTVSRPPPPSCYICCMEVVLSGPCCLAYFFQWLAVPYSRPRLPPALRKTPSRTWNPARRFCPLLPAWWAHIKNQRILNDYITGIVRARWDTIQKERSLAAAATPVTADGNFASANGGGGSGGARASSAAGERKRDILDKVLDSLEPGEWGTAAVLQVSIVDQAPA